MANEMDEFFDFDHAAQNPEQQSHSLFEQQLAGIDDHNLAFVEPELDEDSFQAIQHFSSTQEDQYLSHALDEIQAAQTDTTDLTPEEIADFSLWIDGLYFPAKPCFHCQERRIHCKIIREGYRKGSCTSCVALTRACSLTSEKVPDHEMSDANVPVLHSLESFESTSSNTGDYVLDGNSTVGINGKVYTGIITSRPCEYCHNRGYECKIIYEGERQGSCTSCVALEHSCSLATQENIEELSIDDPLNPNPMNAWLTTKVPDERMGEFAHIKGNHLASDIGGKEALTDMSAFKVPEEDTGISGEAGPKIGARFSRESVRILRGWLSTHHRHPYPSDEEKEGLQRQTGLNKTQITNWLANARRRGKVRAPRSTSPMPQSQFTRGIDIPRKSTPALESMNPLERWKHSPPEHEPASITAISKAVTSSTLSSGHESPRSYGFSDDGSARSIANVSSTSSLGTSNSSNGSFASAFSHRSYGSLGSFGSFGNRGRRRRRRQAPQPVQVQKFNQPARTFQCTFCTETFKTKHDWQRHEKSLHLSLERWICCPDGPVSFSTKRNSKACVYCGHANPPAGHAELHNHSSCAERSLEERTFYRKDHLRQHLNLVHNVKFQAWSMDSWKAATPQIRSRCGFCSIVMDSWSTRVDHLAEHFKSGRTMADWKGDWGFDPQVLEVVANGMPPYLIHNERNSPRPYEASNELTEIRRKTPYEFVKIGLVDYISEKLVHGIAITDGDLLLEAQKIVHNLSSMTDSTSEFPVSWFHDLILLSGDPTRKEAARYTKAESAKAINPLMKDGSIVTRPCEKEAKLMSYVDTRMALGLTSTDRELQAEACRILDDSEPSSSFQCDAAVGWFKFLATASTEWLAEFRRRANLPRSSEMAFDHIRSTDDTTIDYSIHTFERIEREMADYVHLQRALGITPTDVELKDKARLIVFGHDDAWNQTNMDDPEYLILFKRKHGLAPLDGLDSDAMNDMLHLGNLKPLTKPRSAAMDSQSPKSLHWKLERLPGTSLASFMDRPLHAMAQEQPSTNTNPAVPLKHYLNDANCYNRLVRELSRFVASCISYNNPTRHIPSDAELQNQARWIIYDDDDPWNQTAADNAEWLVRFKRDVGLTPDDKGPGLPQKEDSWDLRRIDMTKDKDGDEVAFEDTVTGVKPSMVPRYAPPTKVFYSPVLEQGLNTFVKSELSKGLVPTDAMIQARGHELLSCSETAADNSQLLAKFKAMHGLTEDVSFTGSMLPGFSDPIESVGISPEDAAMLLQFDAEIGAGALNMDIDMNTEMDTGPQDLSADTGCVDYASYYRVNTTTASPLGRRASLTTACKAGFQAPDMPATPSPKGLYFGGFGKAPGARRQSMSPTSEFPFLDTDPDASTF